MRQLPSPTCYCLSNLTRRISYYLRSPFIIIRVFQILLKCLGRSGWGKSPTTLPSSHSKCGGIRNFAGGYFFTGWREPNEDWFWQFEPFSMLKVAFCEYGTSIKIKIDMIWASKEYDIKTNMEQEQWLQLKMLCLLGYNWKVVI